MPACWTVLFENPRLARKASIVAFVARVFVDVRCCGVPTAVHELVTRAHVVAVLFYVVMVGCGFGGPGGVRVCYGGYRYLMRYEEKAGH